MRLVCPNCDAQYEVPDDVIPAEGRDVQCSNCAHSWFFHPTASDDELDDLTAIGELEIPVEPPQSAEPNPTPTDPAEADQVGPEETDTAGTANVEHPRPVPPAPQVAPEVKEVLQAEAARELAAREAERAPMEDQPDLGLDQQPDHQDETDQLDEDDDMPRSDASSTRRDLLPDIEEINSTLTPKTKRNQRPAETPDQRQTKRRRHRFGRRVGFILAVLLAGFAVSVYLYAPVITDRFPQYADALNTYVIWVNDVRGWLANTVGSAVSWFNNLISGAG